MVAMGRKLSATGKKNTAMGPKLSAMRQKNSAMGPKSSAMGKKNTATGQKLGVCMIEILRDFTNQKTEIKQ